MIVITIAFAVLFFKKSAFYNSTRIVESTQKSYFQITEHFLIIHTQKK